MVTDRILIKLIRTSDDLSLDYLPLAKGPLSLPKIASKLCFHLNIHQFPRKLRAVGGIPGLVVMGGDSYPEGRGFESQLHIMDGHFPHFFVKL